jgi:Uma2 family endonuclease
MDAAVVPHPEPYTIEELYALPDDGMRHELYDGALHVSPPPRFEHQYILARLRRLLDRAMPPELEALENVGVRLGTARLLVPDLVVVPRAVPAPGITYLPASAVLLAVEVESPSSVAVDRTVKPAMYAEAGIPTYMRIVPEGEHGTEIHVSRLQEWVYVPHAYAPAGVVLKLDAPFPVAFDPAQLTARLPGV